MPHWHHSARPDTDHDMMRCVVDEAGKFVFVSPALGWALGQNAAVLAGKPLKSMIEIVSPVAGAEQGFHEVALLRQNRDPLVLEARVDAVDAPGDRKLTVIWLDPEQKLRRRKGQDIRRAALDFAVFVGGNAGKAAAAEDKAAGSILNDEGELRHFLNLTSDLLGVYRRDLSFVRVNPAFNRALGFSDAELKHFSFSELIHPDDREQAVQALQKIINAPDNGDAPITEFECHTLCKDGGFRRVSWLVKVAGAHLYIVGQDMTDIRAHEVELERRERQLSEAQKIGHMGHWYWEASGTGMKDKMEWSDQIYSIFGVEKAFFPTIVPGIRALVMKRDVSRLMRAVRRALVRKKDYSVEFRVRRPAGSVRYLRCEGRCKVNPRTGQVEALYGVMQDITDRTLHEKALRAAKESAEEAYSSKARFLANMSHELRTPLNAIIGFSEMIQRQLLGPIGNTRYVDYISGIHQSGEHLLNLINDILDMSKIEVGKYELHIENLNVGKVIRLAVHMVEGRAHESQVKIATDGIADDIQIPADRRALMQILLNLLSNAVKFTPAGGRIDIGCARELGGVAISVADTGIGIPEDKIGVVTLPFEQVDSEFTRRHEGTGLGLAITKDLIELHGGTLDIESEMGKGTTVTVVLPEKDAQAAKPEMTK